MKTMKEKLMDNAAKAMLKVMTAWDDFKNEERGASEMVAVVVLIVIILAVAIVFKDQLINIVNSVGRKVLAWIG